MTNFLKIAKHQNNPLSSNPERELGDFKDFLEEFLISGDFAISSNSFLINYLR
jgi:hypothetical protein